MLHLLHGVPNTTRTITQRQATSETETKRDSRPTAKSNKRFVPNKENGIGSYQMRRCVIKFENFTCKAKAVETFFYFVYVLQS